MDDRYEIVSLKLRTPIETIKNIYNTLQILNEKEYRNSQSILRLQCNICEHKFEKRVCLLKKSGCPVCKAKATGKLLESTQLYNGDSNNRKNAWIEKCKQKHPGLFNYDKVNYVNKDTKVIVGCNACGNDFEILPCQISNSKNRKIIGCPKCNCKQRGYDRALTTETVSERISSKWTLINWQNAKRSSDYITVRCIECKDEISARIGNLVNNMGCVTCYNKRRGDTLRFTKDDIICKFTQFWNNTYDYSDVNYINMATPINVVCKIHGKFDVVPHEHERGRGCQKCSNTTERRLLELLKLHFPDIVHQYKLETCKNINYLPFDYFIPSLNTIIELDGEQHFKAISLWKTDVNTQIERDVFKMKKALKCGMRIIRIYQPDVYRRTDKNVLEMILPTLSDTSPEKISYLATESSIYDIHRQIMLS